MEIQRVSEAYQVMAYGRKSLKTNASEPEKPAETKKESVELSASSINLQKVKEAVEAAPEIRIPIVEEIIKRIENNDYPISRNAEESIDIMLNKGIL